MSFGKPTHIDSLTGIRFYAAFLVFLAHLYHFNYFGITGGFRDFLNVLGAAGVSIFFVLSGFVLKLNYPVLENGVRRFYIARFARIYPAFFVTLLMAIPMELLSAQKTAYVFPFIANLFMTHCFTEVSCGAYNDVGWTLAVEAFFYLSFPLVILLTKRSLAVCGFWVAVVLSLTLVNVTLNEAAFYASRQFPLNRMFEFTLGVFGAMLYLRFLDPSRRNPSRGVLRWMVGLALLTFTVLLYIVPGFSSENGTFIVSGVLSLLLLLGLALLEAGGVRRPVLTSSRVLLLGEISYSFYLVHNLVLRYFRNGMDFVFGEQIESWSVWLQVGAALMLLGIALAASYLLFQYVENPYRRKIKSWLLPKRVPVDTSS